MCSVAIDPTMSALLDAFWTSIDTTREPAWLTDRRTTGMNAFLAMGLPTTDDEAWRFTNLRPLVSAKGLPAPAVDGIADPAFIAANRLPGKAYQIVMVNGAVAADLSEIGTLPAGVWFASVMDTIDLRPDLIKAAFDVSDKFGGQPLASFNAALPNARPGRFRQSWRRCIYCVLRPIPERRSSHLFRFRRASRA